MKTNPTNKSLLLVNSRLICFSVLLIFFLLFQNTLAQFRFDSFTTDNGLPQNGVRGIAQTSDGYLWFTTFDGLVRFDGTRFTVFDKNNTKGIDGNRFVTLHISEDGSLFAGTENSGLTVFKNDTFKTLTVNDGLSSNSIVEFSTDVKGEFIIVTANGNNYFRNGKFVSVPDSEVISSGNYYYSPTGDLWIYDKNGVRQLRPDKSETIYPIKIEAYNEKLSGVELFEDDKGYLWFGDLNGVYRLKDGETKTYGTAEGVPSRVCLRPMIQEADGSIWFASGLPWVKGVGVVRFKDEQFTTWDESVGLSNLLVNGIFKDNEGTIWVSGDKGINHLQKELIRSYSIRDGLISSEVYPLLQTHNGDIYIGTTQGLSLYRDGKFSDAVVKNSKGDKIQVTALAEDKQNRLWIGTLGDTFRFENGRLEKIPELEKITAWAIYFDSAENTWIGTEKGLFLFREDKLIAKYAISEGLPSNDVKVIHEDRKGVLWIGTYGGLVRLEGEKGKGGKGENVTFTPTIFTSENGLASDRIRTIYEDADGKLWIGTYDSGLSRFHDGKFFNYTIENGLFNNGVFQILEDEKNNFWISCNKGIYRVKRKELEDVAAGKLAKINSISYGKEDGMLITEANGGRQPAGIKTADGKLWFPTQDGVAVIDPKDVSFNPNPPPVQIENVLIDRQAFDFQNGITLQANENNLEIRYTGISFVKPEQIKFRYRIEGLSEDWTDVNNIREVYFPSLPSGEYVFHVIAANSDGVWNEAGARLKISVNAPFWKKTWFIALLALAAIFGIFTFFKLRERKLQRRQIMQQEFSRQLLESQEQERKRIASEMHDSIGQYLLAIKNWALFGLNSVSEKDASREFLTEVSETTSLAIEEVREIAHNLRPYQLERLGLTNTLEYMLKNFKNSSAFQVKYEIENIDDFFSKTDEIIFYRIVQESFNNVIKHSEAENIRVSVKLKNDLVEFICRDDGKGFDPETAKISSDSGLGLNGIAERVKILKGDFRIKSESGKGTKVIVKVGKVYE